MRTETLVVNGCLGDFKVGSNIEKNQCSGKSSILVKLATNMKGYAYKWNILLDFLGCVGQHEPDPLHALALKATTNTLGEYRGTFFCHAMLIQFLGFQWNEACPSNKEILNVELWKRPDENFSTQESQVHKLRFFWNLCLALSKPHAPHHLFHSKRQTCSFLS